MIPGLLPNGMVVNFAVPVAMMPVPLPRAALDPELLRIIKWFRALDADEHRRIHGVCLSDFGPLLEDMGFSEIT